MLPWIIAIVIVILDLASKHLVQTNTSLHAVTVVEGFFKITYVKNTGMAWSLLEGQQVFLSLVSLAASAGMIYYLAKKKPDKPTAISVALLLGGALGNLFDRVFLGYVRDFLDFYIFGYNFPVFNVADSALTIGVVLLLVITTMEDKK